LDHFELVLIYVQCTNDLKFGSLWIGTHICTMYLWSEILDHFELVLI